MPRVLPRGAVLNNPLAITEIKSPSPFSMHPEDGGGERFSVLVVLAVQIKCDGDFHRELNGLAVQIGRLILPLLHRGERSGNQQI